MKWFNRTLLVASAITVAVATSAGVIVLGSIALVGSGVNEVYQQVSK
jgi:hypothetical protein